MDQDAAEAAALLTRWGIKRGMTPKQLQMDGVATVLLDIGLIFHLLFLLFIGAQGLGVQGVVCDTCDGRIAIAGVVLVAGLLGTFVPSVAVSIVLHVRQRLAFYIPIIGWFAMTSCLVAAYVIAGLWG